jgi:hypothetical protein
MVTIRQDSQVINLYVPSSQYDFSRSLSFELCNLFVEDVVVNVSLAADDCGHVVSPG